MTRIGPFEILGLLGQGGMSKVYKVRHPSHGKIRALKILSPQPLLKKLLGLEELKRLFRHEAEIMAGLAHPNIVAVRDRAEFEGIPYYLMEYYCSNLGFLIGETYAPENPSRPLTPDKALCYLQQTLEGLAALHRAGIVHRDIKPFNLMITDRDRIKISDFGLALWRGESYAGPPNLKVGSPYYTAPEQEERPDQVDPRSDLYSAGVVFYRLLIGRLPVVPWENPSLSHRDLDAPWDAFMGRALSENRAERFQSAEKMLQSLKELLAHWETKKKNACSEDRPKSQEPPKGARPRGPKRSSPVRIGPREARSFFQLDRLWRPVHYNPGELEIRPQGTVYDKTTDLLWQQNGSTVPLTWEEAHDYIAHLNRDRFAGYSTWKRPTVDALCTLLKERPEARTLCLSPLFDPVQRSLWSADRRSYRAGWLANVELGFISWQDFSCRNYVRAVTSV